MGFRSHKSQKDEVWRDFWRELDRSRRYDGSFALISVQRLFSAQSGPSANWTRLTRNVDCVWFDGAGTYLLLPETNRLQAVSFIERLSPLGLTDAFELRLVVFPTDGITGGALLERLALQDVFTPSGRHSPPSPEVRIEDHQGGDTDENVSHP